MLVKAPVRLQGASSRGEAEHAGRGSSSGTTTCWDAESSWQPWAQHADPIGSIELDLAWEGIHLPIESPSLKEVATALGLTGRGGDDEVDSEGSGDEDDDGDGDRGRGYLLKTWSHGQ